VQSTLLRMDKTLQSPTIENKPAVTPSRLADFAWLAAIVLVMATTTVWELLSPRPEIGKVAVLWMPNAVLVVALLRNWGRPFFCILLLALFFGVGIYPAFQSDSVISSSFYLSIDIIEAALIVFGLILWFGKSFS
jgi:hypothetical protein